jgi:hypothetical protein
MSSTPVYPGRITARRLYNTGGAKTEIKGKPLQLLVFSFQVLLAWQGFAPLAQATLGEFQQANDHLADQLGSPLVTRKMAFDLGI